jgi:hypothetical protein
MALMAGTRELGGELLHASYSTRKLIDARSKPLVLFFRFAVRL